MGFWLKGAIAKQPLIAALIKQKKAVLDELQLGIVSYDNNIFPLGPPMQGDAWETIAVPEIRKQCLSLASTLIGNHHEQ